MQTLLFHPVDAWFFNGPRPYDKDGSDQTNVPSRFPPSPRTLVGAVRAQLARHGGWDGRSRWTDDLKGALGDGHDDLGALQFSAPLLFTDRPGDGDSLHRLVPAPLFVLGKTEQIASRQTHDGPKEVWRPQDLLGPGSSSSCMTTDIGDASLPTRQGLSDAEGLEEASGVWVTIDYLERLLAQATNKLPNVDQELDGDVTDHIYESGDLWSLEPRVGIARNNATKKVEQGQLYSPSFVRPARHVTLGAGVHFDLDNVDNSERWANWQTALEGRVTLGGESRMANTEFTDAIGSLRPQTPDDLDSADRVAVTLLTPTLLTPASPPDVKNDLYDLEPGQLDDDHWGSLHGARLISACIGKPEYIGGWDPKHNCPLDVEAYAPAGTTLFVDTADTDIDFEDATNERLGPDEYTDYGFGEFAVSVVS